LEELIVYYAHSMKIYGSDREKKEIAYIKKKFKSVVNPAVDLIWQGSMELYFKAVKESDIVICSEYEKHIGKGVFDEIFTALLLEKKVFCIRKLGRGYKLLEVSRVEVVDKDDWSVYFGKVILK
jgi:hypothetical protein